MDDGANRHVDSHAWLQHFNTAAPTSPPPDPMPHDSAQAFHAFLANASYRDVDAALFKIAMDWNVGNALWPHLSQQFRDQIAAIRRDARANASGGVATASFRDIDAVLCKIAMDWNVGNALWPHLSQQFRDQIAAI